MEPPASLASSPASAEQAIAPEAVASRTGLPRRGLILLFAFALVLRLAHVLAMTGSPHFANPVIDAAEYHVIGWSLAQGHGYPERVFWHPPGYPCFLGGVWWLLGAITLGMALMVQIFFVTARYRVLLVPFLLIFAAEGGRWLVRTASRQQRIVAGLAVLALLLLANLGQGPMDRRKNPDAEYSLSTRLGERGHLKEAQALFESVVAARPSYVAAWLNLAVCYDETGRAGDAEAAVRRALLPDKDAATILRRFMAQGKPEVAQKLLEHVRAIVAGRGQTP